ncbi:Rib/alpha-like domain-containing protein [Enterococcus gallinarum]|uniref:Rib/alpha-like domain-containing protein n=1 Tax=Enterococcus gallinarum TaxID=1353 RepID=UPI001C3E6B44|nr:Rib/alpha-like domain-containing protein [Enterococcus gallinarum]MDL4875670.1 Rib/alpha-like domain-containing protein [Enterococcus gallinarum]MDL4921252.1 Rib/alpha-like domain-containing protein [Enterococcus gallinarum]MDL4982958.1 Rib/alpha-like domain-containing protein [Enterococcus gallinarum]
MFSKNNRKMYQKISEKRILKYSIKKLSVGVASVLVGTGIILGTGMLSEAQSVTSRLVDYAASGNTFEENPGYSKNYNFSDLQFKPDKVESNTLSGNTINFEMYGKHNIAASTDNWEIRLQLDERLAKYVKDIQVDPKSGLGSNRRTLVRTNDSLGRARNIWKVNYIRASNGLFAGAETTDTQVAPNGVITFEKSLEEIFKEIGEESLKNDKLIYRVYLVSHQDNDKIVPGIESTGYFVLDNDFSNTLDPSPHNNDQFRTGSINSLYEAPNIQTNDGLGSTGDNGSIVIDHKITKMKNFSYNASANGTPWKANFKVDERLVPYISGIQMHKVAADSVTYDISFPYGKKVVDLSIERRKDHPNYGMGTITDNDLTNLIDFANASPRPIVIRYVYQLTKPLDEILEEFKKSENIDGNSLYAEDFIFDAWLTDNDDKLIQNTFGTGYYHLQDIDGDGTTDDKEEENKTSPFVGKPQLNEVYDVDTTIAGSVYLHELAGSGNVVRLIDQQGNIVAEQPIEVKQNNGVSTSDVVKFEFTGVDSSKLNADEELKVQIVSPNYDQPEEGSTIVKESPKPIDKKAVGMNSKPDPKESIKNNKKIPESATYVWKTEPDTSKISDSTIGVVTVTIGDREFDVDVEFSVESTQAVENKATYKSVVTEPETKVQSDEPTFDKPDVPLAQNPFAIGADFDKALGEATIDSATGIVTFTPAKGIGEDSPTEVKIPVSITYEDGSVGTTELLVAVGKEVYPDPGGNIPAGYHKVTFTAGEGTSIESGTTVFAVKDGVSLPEDKLPVLKAKDGYTDAKWPAEAIQPITADDTEFTSTATKLDDIIENPGGNIPAGYHKVTFTVGEGTSIESGTTVFAVKDGVSLPEDKLPVLKAKDGYTDAKWPAEATQPITADDTEFTSTATKLDNKSEADKYEPTVDKEVVEIGGKVDLTDNVTNLPDLPAGTTVTDVTPGGTIDTNTPGNYEGIIEVTYPDGTKDTVKVPVEVTDNRADADKYEPTVDKEVVEIGGTVDLTDNVTNLPDLPAGTTVTDVTPEGTIDTNTPGNYEGIIEVTYPDGTKDTVKVPVEVTDNRADADKYEPTVDKEVVEIGGTVDLTDNVTNLPDLPAGTTVTDVTPEGTIDTSTSGNYEGVIEVTYPDGTKDTVKVPVEVTDSRTDADKYTPSAAGEEIELGGTYDLTDNIVNLPDLPAGTTVVDVTPAGAIDTNTPGEYQGTVEVIYPDGTKDTVPVSVKVVDNRTNADKYEPTVEKEQVEIGGTVDLTDNVTNLPDLPAGTTVTDVTPEGTIDTNTPGNYGGVIEVTYPDGTKDTVKVPVEVTDNRANADKYEPTVEKEQVEIGGKVDLTDNVTNLPDLPAGTTVTDVTPGGTIDTNTPGNYEGIIEVTYPDGTKDTVKVPVEVTDNRTDAEKYNPEGQNVTTELNKEPSAAEAIKNKEILPKGTTYSWKEKVDVSTLGDKKGVVVITYPDGSTEEVEVVVSVIDTVAPEKPSVNPIKPGDTTISGKTEPNVDVTVTLPDGSEYTSKSDSEGNFEIEVPNLKAGDKVRVIATDSSGNKSEPTDAIVSEEKVLGLGNSNGNTPEKRRNETGVMKWFGKQLPKTGELNSNVFIISGAIILLSSLGLLGYKKGRKENE